MVFLTATYITYLITHKDKNRNPNIYSNRDWLYVKDHCYGILAILEKGKVGERLFSKSVDTRANISKGAYISGRGENLVIGSHVAIGVNCKVCSNLTIVKGTMMGPECVILSQHHRFNSESLC